MPLSLLLKLDAEREKVLGFRRVLADAPVYLERAEGALKTFDRVRDELRKIAPRFHEEKGILAGIRAAGPIIAQHQEMTRNSVRDEILGVEVGKEMIAVLARAAQSTLDASMKQEEGVQKSAGKLEGLSWAARDALEQVSDVLRHYATVRDVGQEDPDWSGREAASDASGSDSGGDNGKSGAKPKGKKKKAKRVARDKEAPKEN